MSQINTTIATNLEEIQVGLIPKETESIHKIDNEPQAVRPEWKNYEKIIFRIAFIFP